MFLLRLHSHAAAFVLVPFILLQRADVTDDTLPNSSCASVATRCQQQRYNGLEVISTALVLRGAVYLWVAHHQLLVSRPA